MLDGVADAEAEAEADANAEDASITEDDLAGVARTELDAIGAEAECALSPEFDSIDDKINVTSSISTISLGHSS